MLCERVPLSAEEKERNGVRDDNDGNDDDDEYYDEEENSPIIGKAFCDKLKTREAINNTLKVKLTRDEYEQIRKQLCHRDRILHVDIARELDIAIIHNNPTKEEHKDKCKYNKDNSVLLVWTDGSADASKKSVGYAVWWASEHPLNYSRRMNYPTNTNNEAELTAILHALTVVPVEQSLEIITDSEIAVKVCTALQRANSVTLSALTRRDSATTARGETSDMEKAE